MAFMTPSALDEIDTALEDQRRLSAIVISLQRQAQTQGPESAPSAGNANATSVQAPHGLEPSVAATTLHRPHSNSFHLVLLTGMLLVALGAGWSSGSGARISPGGEHRHGCRSNHQSGIERRA